MTRQRAKMSSSPKAAAPEAKPADPEAKPAVLEAKSADPEEQPLVTQVEVPPKSLKEELVDTYLPVKQLIITKDDPLEQFRGKRKRAKVKEFFFWLIPILEWLSTYKVDYILGDLVGGLTIASLAVPQVSQTPELMRHG